MATLTTFPEDERPERITIVIPCEDELVHSDKHPFCADPTCPCQQQALLMPYSTADRNEVTRG